jgi:carboxypeptidase family protein/TonB-dependent receptor-like protein
MHFAKKSAWISIICFVAFGLPVLAQTRGGEANGTIIDSSGAVVPGAVVTLTNQATNIQNTATSNNNGYFVFVNVQPGGYKLKVEKSGFKAVESSFQVAVNQAVTQNMTLDVGSASTTIEVTAQAPVLDSTTSSLGTVIEEKTIQSLPLNGRNFTQLLTLTPGVTPVSTSQNKSIGGVEGNVGIPGSGFSDPSFHGQENRSKLYFYDGIINTNIRGPTYIVIPNIDMVQEFKVVGQDANADMGGAAGGVVNMVSKSGTNKFHGSAFEYVRNNAFDARNGFTDFDAAGNPKPPAPYHQNQFGATVSGPIIHERTFFSAGYDGWRFSQPTQATSYVPTAAELNGDFSQTATTSGTSNQIYNPFSTLGTASAQTRSPFMCDAAGNPLAANAQGIQPAGTACNKIPQALINPAMQAFLKAYVGQPNYANPADPQHNFIQNRPSINNSNEFNIRVDHRFSQRDNVFLRFTQQNVYTFTPIGENAETDGGSPGRNYGGDYVHTFGPNLIFDFRAGYAGRPGVDSSMHIQNKAGTGPMTSAGFTDIDKYQGMLATLATPWNNGAGGNGNIGTRGIAPRENPTRSFTPSLQWLKGNHNIKMGFWYIDAKRVQDNTFQTFAFANTQTENPANASNTGLSLASALLALPNSATGQLPNRAGGEVAFSYASWAGYVQDEWKARPNLTLTMGLRFDYLTQPQTTDGRLWNSLDLQNQLWIIGANTMPGFCSAVGQAPCIPDKFQSDPHFNRVVLAGKQFFAPGPIKDNFGPRLGIAWQLHPKTVLRAGAGLYWDALPARSQYAQNDLEAEVWPDAVAFATGNVNTDASFVPGSATPFQFLNGIQGHFPVTLPTVSPWGIGGFSDDPRYKDPYALQYHLEIQQELTPQTMFSVAYVGSQDGRLPFSGLANAARQASPNNTCAKTDSACNAAYKASVDALRPMPWVNINNYTMSIARSSYNGLEGKLDHRFSNGLSSLVSYTWSKSIDEGSGYFGVENSLAGGGSTVQSFYNLRSARGPSGYDITHFFSWANVYELPFGRGKRFLSSGPLSWLLGNWESDSILQARSGIPYNLQATGDIANLQGSAPSIGTYGRPNLIADPFTAGPVLANPDPACHFTVSQKMPNGKFGSAPDSVLNKTNYFNPCAFTQPSASFGNLGRNAFRSPAVWNMDYAMMKNFVLGEQMRLQLQFQFFNVFNVQNWEGPSQVTVNSSATTINPKAGQITSLAQGTTPREMQFGLRFVF